MKELKETLIGFVIGIIICAIITMCTSCAHTKYVTVPEIHTQYISKTDSILMHDSIYMHDSIFTLVHGDTVLTTKWHTKYIEKLKYINKTDTMLKTDTITKVVKEEVTKTKHDYSGWYAFILLLAGLGIYVYNKMER